MGGLDDAIAGLGGGSILVALLVAVLLGLRHATDPDHLTAVATLIVSDAKDGPAAVDRTTRSPHSRRYSSSGKNVGCR